METLGNPNVVYVHLGLILHYLGLIIALTALLVAMLLTLLQHNAIRVLLVFSFKIINHSFFLLS